MLNKNAGNKFPDYIFYAIKKSGDQIKLVARCRKIKRFNGAFNGVLIYFLITLLIQRLHKLTRILILNKNN